MQEAFYGQHQTGRGRQWSNTRYRVSCGAERARLARLIISFRFGHSGLQQPAPNCCAAQAGCSHAYYDYQAHSLCSFGSWGSIAAICEEFFTSCRLILSSSKHWIEPWSTRHCISQQRPYCLSLRAQREHKDRWVSVIYFVYTFQTLRNCFPFGC